VIELAPGQATAAVRALCATEGHAWRRCVAVLDGTAGGRILTDDPAAPGWVGVQEFSDAGVLFLAGSLDRDLVAEVIGRLRQGRVVSVGLAPGFTLSALLPSDFDEDGADIELEDRDPGVALARFVAPPAGLRLEPIDRDLVPRCLWGPWMVASLETALDHGRGYCLLDGELVVAEAFAGPAVGGVLEMAVITREAYQRRGLATVVCARTILECERRGDRTWWSAAAANAASVGLARKLGYRTERRFRVLSWSPLPV
jgi:GNAT superfamily N-acetyltransferase